MIPKINSSHGSETRNIINEIIKAINDRGLEILSESAFSNWLYENGAKHQGEWSDTKEYEILSVVLHEGNSYTSKKQVPAGIDILNEEYWVLTGNYNAQAEYNRERLKQFPVNIRDFGAVGDGVTKDVQAIQDTMDSGNERVFIPKGDYLITDGWVNIRNGVILEGEGYDSFLRLVNTDGNGIRVSGDNVIIRNIRIGGDAQGGITIRGNAKNVLIEQCHFEDITQIVWLHNCENVTVQNCTFENSGYGVIQHTGTSSNHVKVINNTVINAKSDFVECNSVASKTIDWIISGNQFTGALNYSDGTKTKSENRFIGVTNVDGMIVTNNYIKNAGGDSAIHCEDATGKVIISGNIMEDCKPTEGNQGWIYLIGDTPEICKITNNIFIKNDDLYKGNYAVSNASFQYSNKIMFSNNTVIARNGSTFSGLNMHNHTNWICTDNHFINNDIGVSMKSTHKTDISGNTFENCNIAIGKVEQEINGHTGNDNHIRNNTFIDNGIDLNIMGNGNGTGRNYRWLITGNAFSSEINLSSSGNNGASARNGDFMFTNNMLSSDSLLNDSHIDRLYKNGNFKVGTGAMEV